MRLIACKHCGKVHAKDFNCGSIPSRKKNTDAEKLRSSYKWQQLREKIKARDFYLCRWSLAHGELVADSLEVHHIIPIEERPDLALEPSNLITLTARVHERAERGEIPREALQQLAVMPPKLTQDARNE